MRRLLLSFFLLLAGLVPADTVILWFVDDPDIQEINGGTVKISDLTSRGEYSGLSAEYVRMSATGDTVSGSDYLYLSYDKGGWEYTDTDLYIGSGDRLSSAGPAYANISDFFGDDGSYDASLKFMIEIGNYAADGTWVAMAVSDVVTVAELAAGGHLFSDELQYQGSIDWGGGHYAVPEPSGGMLVLLGACLLALRRRRMA